MLEISGCFIEKSVKKHGHCDPAEFCSEDVLRAKLANSSINSLVWLGTILNKNTNSNYRQEKNSDIAAREKFT